MVAHKSHDYSHGMGTGLRENQTALLSVGYTGVSGPVLTRASGGLRLFLLAECNREG